MIHVLATVTVRAGTRPSFLEEFRRVRPLVHAEAGCLEYDAAVDLATGIGAQIPLRDEVVTIVEKWESLEHLKAHLAAPHMGAYRERVKEYVQQVTLQVLAPA